MGSAQASRDFWKIRALESASGYTLCRSCAVPVPSTRCHGAWHCVLSNQILSNEAHDFAVVCVWHHGGMWCSCTGVWCLVVGGWCLHRLNRSTGSLRVPVPAQRIYRHMRSAGYKLHSSHQNATKTSREESSRNRFLLPISIVICRVKTLDPGHLDLEQASPILRRFIPLFLTSGHVQVLEAITPKGARRRALNRQLDPLRCTKVHCMSARAYCSIRRCSVEL